MDSPTTTTAELEFVLDILDRSVHSTAIGQNVKDILSTLVDRFQACAAIIWLREDEQFYVESQIRPAGVEMPALRLSEDEHERILAEQQPSAPAKIVPDAAVDGDWTLAIISFRVPGAVRVLEILVPGGLETDREGVLERELAVGAKLLNVVFSQQARQESAVSTPQLAADQDFQLLVHESIDFAATAETVANEMRRVLKVDRVTVFRRKGKQWIIQAVSGQVKVNRRSGLLRRLTGLATRALATGRPFYHPSHSEPLPPIAEALRDFLDHTETRFLAIRPAFTVKKSVSPRDSENANARQGEAFAAVAVEHYRGVPQESVFVPRFDACFSHAESALRNAHEHRRLFLYPLWKTLGKSRIITAARNLKISIAVLLCVVAVGLVLSLWPADFNVVADGVLVPVERRKIFAELDGVAVSVPVDHQTMVAEGQPLAVLVNRELLFQLEQVDGEIRQLRQQYTAIQAGRIANSPTTEPQDTNVKGLQMRLESLGILQETLRGKANRLNITSPISGQVITWDVKDRLMGRPVAPGEMLMEVADVSGDWELVINVPSRKVGHVLRADDALDRLKVVYAIASEPSNWRTGEVIAIEGAARLQPDQTQTISLRVKIDLADVEYPANTGVMAKVYCGQRSVGYVWGHDAWEWVQENVFFRFF